MDTQPNVSLCNLVGEIYCDYFMPNNVTKIDVACNSLLISTTRELRCDLDTRKMPREHLS